MLGDVEQTTEPRYAFDRLDVLWPTFLAHAVLHGAVAHAERRLDDTGSARAAALAAARRTLRDYEAVEGGGLVDVWL